MTRDLFKAVTGVSWPAALLLACPALTHASPLIDASTPVAGVSQQALARQHSAWLFTATNPPPMDRALLNTMNPGPVTFLPSSFKPTETFDLTVRAGVPLFLSVLAFQAWFGADRATDDFPACNAVPLVDRFTCNQTELAALTNNPTSLTLVVDGVSISVPDSNRQSSGGIPFDVMFGPDSEYLAFGSLPGTPYQALFDGWWAALDPLSPGKHVVQYGFDYGGSGVMQTANLSVVPVSSTVSLAALGLLMLAVHSRRQRSPN